MGIVILIMGCFLLYGNSKYFPENLSYVRVQIKKYPKVIRILAYTLFLISYTFFYHQLGWGTAIIVFIIALVFSLCITLIVIPIHKRYVYVIATLSLLIIILENII